MQSSEGPGPAPQSATELTVFPGFGTAHLMGRVGARESTRLIHAALEFGVVHFDTARLYGLGDAEHMLGRALRGRSDAAIYTKAGRGNPRHSRLTALAHSVVRPLARARVRAAGWAGKHLGPALAPSRQGNFSPEYLRTSVETSLELLNRETLDGLLLHEMTAADASQEVVGLMEALVREGKVRRFGIASEHANLVEILATDFPYQILQQAGGPFVQPIEGGFDGKSIFHSVFGASGQDLHPFQSWLSENKGQHDALLDVAGAESLKDIPTLLISYTATKWTPAGILFSSVSENHIRANVAAVRHRLSTDSLQAVSAVLDTYKI